METPMISQLRASVEPSKAPAAAELLTSSHSKAATCSRSNLSDPAACPSVNIKIVVKCPVDWCSSKIYGQKSWYCDDYKLGLSPPNIYRKKHEHLWYWYMYIWVDSHLRMIIYIYTYIHIRKSHRYPNRFWPFLSRPHPTKTTWVARQEMLHQEELRVHHLNQWQNRLGRSQRKQVRWKVGTVIPWQ